MFLGCQAIKTLLCFQVQVFCLHVRIFAMLYLVPMEAIKGPQLSCKWSSRKLRISICVLGTEPRSSVRAEALLTAEPSPAFRTLF